MLERCGFWGLGDCCLDGMDNWGIGIGALGLEHWIGNQILDWDSSRAVRTGIYKIREPTRCICILHSVSAEASPCGCTSTLGVNFKLQVSGCRSQVALGFSL